MRKYIAGIVLCSATALAVSAQDFAPNYKYKQFPKYQATRASQPEKFVEWVENPVLHAVPPEYADQPAYYVLRDVTVDYRYEGKDINCFRTNHQIVKVLDEAGIEWFGTIELPVGFATRVPSIKARTIGADGKVHDIAKDMIKVTKDPSGYYKVIIAMEGVEKNSEVELLAKTITPYSFYGQNAFQGPLPIQNARFVLTYPADMNFEMKSHNGFPELKDEESKKRKHFEVMLNDIPALKNEPHSFYGLHRMAIEYRVKNFKGNTERPKIYTWDDYARRIWDNNYKLTEKEKAAVNKFLSDLGVRPNGNEVDNIKKIEKGIKTNITMYAAVDYDQRKEVLATRDFRSMSTYSNDYDEKKAVLDSIITRKAATESGYVKLFAACLTQAGIKHELGTTGERDDYAFDKNFENWQAMSEYVIYFPNQKRFLSPTSPYLRYPVIPEQVAGNKGVFCAIASNGIASGLLYNFRTVTPLSAAETQSNITAGVTFNKEMDAQVDISYAYTGYSSTDLRQKLAFTRQDKMKELVQNMLPFLDKPENLQRYTISNENFNNYYQNKPLEIYASLNTSALTEKAGKNYLFKVGELIGQQEELYSEKERTMPVDLYHPQSMKRTITINIPKGYKIMNPEALQLSADYVNEELDPVISFKSDYRIVKDKVKGDKLIISVNESYNKLHFNTYEYERYRKVVNTAADFNKVALLIGKKA